MTRNLRRKHRAIFSALAVVLPVSFATAMAVRPLGTRTGLPSGGGAVAALTAPAGPEFGAVVWRRSDLWGEGKVVTSLRKDPAGHLAIEIISWDLSGADLLLYWVPGRERTRGDVLPGDARLVGSIRQSAPLPVSAEMERTAGSFILYSLGSSEIIARTRPFSLQGD